MTKRCRNIHHTMSTTQQAPAPNMTETSVIKHYKKQLIYRQHDVPDPAPQFLLNEVSNTKIYDLLESEKNKNKNDLANCLRKTRRKRKNKNCRGQFRHEAMELIKLGNSSQSLAKPKDPRIEKPPPPPVEPIKEDHNVPKVAPIPTVIQSNFATKPSILEAPAKNPPAYTHALPQMVPERRNSRELLLKPPSVYTSPPHHPNVPEYRLPFPLPHAYPHPPMPYRPTATLPPPPPYPVARSPPRPVPRSPIRPIPQQAQAYHRNGAYTGIHFPFTRAQFNGYHDPKKKLEETRSIVRAGHNIPKAEFHAFNGYCDSKKRKLEEERNVVAAIDLTVDHRGVRRGEKQHKCQCECGKTYTNPVTQQEVIITVKDRDNSQVPSTYIRGRMVNGVLQFEQDDEAKRPATNGHVKNPPGVPKAPPPAGGKLPPLFLIDDLLGKKRPSLEARKDAKIPVPIRTEPNRVIVSTNHVEEAIPRTKSKDYSVSTIIGSDNRRQSVDIDTISISSSGSESVRSPRPRSAGVEKHIPHGKLFYYKNNNSFIRYFDDTQKKLFLDSISSDCHDKTHQEDKGVIELPRNTIFSPKDNLTVEEYVSEMTLVEKFIPRDFFLFYKFVTGYQICNNNLPVSFLTFLKVYNTNGLKVLLERYVNSLKQ